MSAPTKHDVLRQSAELQSMFLKGANRREFLRGLIDPLHIVAESARKELGDMQLLDTSHRIQHSIIDAFTDTPYHPLRMEALDDLYGSIPVALAPATSPTPTSQMAVIPPVNQVSMPL